MAMQTGVGLSKILILAGTGYAGTILLKNGKLSDVLAELQSLLKGIEKNGESVEGDTADAIASQVRRLAMEVRQLASARPITVLNGSSGNVTPLLVPAAGLGALAYGYMWWKGLSLWDLMWVTKSSMANAVSNLTKHLASVSEAVAAAKKHLSQRIDTLDGKLDDQVEMSKLIKNEVTGVRVGLDQIGVDLDELQKMVRGLDGKIMSLEDKQDFANMGVMYLCNFVDAQNLDMPKVNLQEKLNHAGKSRGYLTSSGTPNAVGLKILEEFSGLGNATRSITDGTDTFDEKPRSLTRTASIKC